MPDVSPGAVPGVVRAEEWQDWQSSRRVGRWTRACLQQALEISLSQWRDRRSRFEAELKEARSRHDAELQRVHQDALDRAHTEAMHFWSHHLAVWRQERQSQLLNLRDDVASLISEVVAVLMNEVSFENRMALIRDHLDLMIDQRHTVQLHVAPTELVVAKQAMQACWSEAAWRDAVPHVLADPTVSPGSIRAVTIGGVLELDWPKQLAHLQRLLLAVEQGPRT